jgi:hypothetical protein
MCWSGEASLGVAAVGVAGSLWARQRGAPVGRWATLLYFTGMELLQATTYTVIDRCGLPLNLWLTRVSYVHISLQPFFINLLALSFVAPQVAKRARPFVLFVCAAGSLVMLSKFFVHSPEWACNPATVSVCGADTCSYHGEWHIAWRLYLSGLDNNFYVYWLPAFALPLLYGSWRWTLYHALVGPFAAFFMSSNKDEIVAIWCLTSIGFLLAIHVPRLEHWLEAPRRLLEAASDAVWLRTLASGFAGTAAFIGGYLLLRVLRGSVVLDPRLSIALCLTAAVLAVRFALRARETSRRQPGHWAPALRDSA